MTKKSKRGKCLNFQTFKLVRQKEGDIYVKMAKTRNCTLYGYLDANIE